MHTIASNGPSPDRRQAGARASRWNWSHDTGNAFCDEDAMVALSRIRDQAGIGAGWSRLTRSRTASRPHVDGQPVLAAHDDLVGEAARREGRIGADRDVGMRLGNLAEPRRIKALRNAARGDRLDVMRAPVASVGATLSSMACMIAGTPAMTMTLPMQDPGAREIGLSMRSAPSGMRAMRRRASLRSSGL